MIDSYLNSWGVCRQSPSFVGNHHPFDVGGKPKRSTSDFPERGFTGGLRDEQPPVPLDQAGGGVIWVVGKVQHNQLSQGMIGCRSRVGLGSLDGSIEDGQELAALVASLNEPAVELFGSSQLVFRVTAESVNPKEVPIYHPR